jgi:hypothetical protein
MGVPVPDEEEYAHPPTDDLQTSNYNGHNIPHFGSANDTAGCVPISNCDVNRNWGSDYREVKNQHRENRKRKSDAVIKRALVLQVLDFSFGFACFQASGTDVLAMEVAIT